MPWPLSQDYNEAIQNPGQCFADPELRQGQADTNELGLPAPRSGNFADVYAVASARVGHAALDFVGRCATAADCRVALASDVPRHRSDLLTATDPNVQWVDGSEHWRDEKGISGRVSGGKEGASGEERTPLPLHSWA